MRDFISSKAMAISHRFMPLELRFAEDKRPSFIIRRRSGECSRNAIIYAALLWRRAGSRSLAEAFGLVMIAAIITSYYSYEYDLLSLMVPLVAIIARSGVAFEGDRINRYLWAAGLLLLIMPLYWFMRVYLKAEFLMTLPLFCVGIALAGKLHQAGAQRGVGQPASGLRG